jgi:hypothetical protein
MQGIRNNKKPTKAEIEQNAKNLIIREVALAMKEKKAAEDQELKAYVKILEARAWVGIASAVLIGLAWLIYELIKL